nr:receptor-like protein kinase haiku2 [Quercus suber]
MFKTSGRPQAIINSPTPSSSIFAFPHSSYYNTDSKTKPKSPPSPPLSIRSGPSGHVIQPIFPAEAGFVASLSILSQPDIILQIHSWTQANSLCNFTGIACNSNGLVREINLPKKNLHGILPFDAICSLQSLEKLSLASNFLYGTITDDLKNCTSLQHLDMGWNKFSGKVPDLSPLGKLEFLNLNNSGFSGPFPWRSLENLTSLTFLSLGDNFFEPSTFPVEVFKLEKLYWLYLSNCSLTGQIPEGIGNLSQLINLELSCNQFTGVIPADIGKLKNLRQLELYSNSLTGKLPVGFGNLTSLANLDMSRNKLQGTISEVRFLTNLVSLHLYENQFTGEVPEELGEFKNLTNISVYRNKFTGPLPQKLGSLGDFLYIDVAENFLTGPIPPDMCKNGLCSQNLKHLQPCSSGSSTRSQLWTSCLIAGAVILLLVLACCLCVKLRHNNLDSPLKRNSWDMKPYHILTFTEKEILDGIKNENQIGKGGSGNVYRVELTDGKELAVKHIWISDSGEYEAEVATLSSVRHVNVVKLYCSITSEDSSLLVYEYLPNGSLWDRLHNCSGKMEMGWEANGGDWTHAIAGTLGYMAPEYAYTYKVNEKSDVYSFGVVLLELVMGKRPIDLEFGENKDIVCWVCSKISNKESVLDLVDSTISEALKEDAIKVMRIAIHCTSKLPSLRPSMRMVVQMLEEAEPCKLT